MKITGIWRNDGWWMNMHIVLDDKYKIDVRLFNDGTADILIEDVTDTDALLIQIDDTSCINIESDIIGKEYSLPDNLDELESMIFSCYNPDYGDLYCSYIDIIRIVNKTKMNLFSIDKEDVETNKAKKLFEEYPDIKELVNDIFHLAHHVVVKVIDKQNKREEEK